MSSKTTRNTPYRFITWLLSVALIASFISIPAGAQEQSSEEECSWMMSKLELDGSAEAKFRRRGGDNFKSPRAAERYQRRQEALKQNLDCQVGFHAHNNLGVGIGNSIAALEVGADQLDGSLRGLGAGAGNAPTELLAAVLDKMEVETGLDAFKLMDAAEYTIAPMMPFQPMPDRDSIMIGYAGVYSTFLLHAKRAAERYEVDVRDVLVELGEREAVAGQEDWVIDVALDVAKEKEGAAS